MVSIHAPVKVRPLRVKTVIVNQPVSIHAPVKVRLFLVIGDFQFFRFQFTHL